MSVKYKLSPSEAKMENKELRSMENAHSAGDNTFT